MKTGRETVRDSQRGNMLVGSKLKMYKNDLEPVDDSKSIESIKSKGDIKKSGRVLVDSPPPRA